MKKHRRASATETFSVSVDAETKRALRLLADREFGGNLSALVTDFAEEARRRMAAAELLRMHGVPRPTAEDIAGIEAEIAGEVTAAKRKKRRKAA